MTRFEVRVTPSNSYGYAWDNVMGKIMGDGKGGLITFDALDPVERDDTQAIVNEMNKRVAA